MCTPIDDVQMLCWLRAQLKVLSAWREELVCRNETDLEAVTRLEQHHQWLHGELQRLDPAEQRNLGPARQAPRASRA